MAPAASKLRAEAGLQALPRRALAQYLRLLQLYPVLTKAATRSARRGRDRAGGGPEHDPAWSSDGPEHHPAGSSDGPERDPARSRDRPSDPAT